MSRHEVFHFALKKTIPIMTGFIFLGIAYGLYMHQQGFNVIYPTVMAMTIFGGSVEFIIANLLREPFNPWPVFWLTLIVNSRHLFYGISMLEKYRNAGRQKKVLIFGLCDETFSINYAIKLPSNVNAITFYFDVTLLNYFYWVLGAFLGGLLGQLVVVKLEGLPFVLTALFLVLFVDQLQREQSHFSSISGIITALTALLIFGHNLFLPISMLLVVFIFSIREHFWSK